jgi:TRAP-type C4-dicarboxylate transport system substrate-binding protein
MRTIRKTCSMAALLALALITARAGADEKIKLGTLAPNGSTWHTLLKEMGQKWSDASGGKVKLIIYPGGVVGNEGDMVKKMRIGQLQAAALTNIGLHDIAPDPQVLDVPMTIDTAQTLDFVLERMGPQIEKALADKGYIVIGWADVGFARFFSTKKYSTLAELQQAKVFAWEGDPASVEAWRAAGFHPVVASSTDIVPSLQTGLIDTVALAPLYAYTSRVFERAKYMVDLPWASLSGATVVKRDAWEKIPADLRPKLLEIAHEYGAKITAEVRRMDADALKSMKQQGLVVVEPADAKAFQKAADGATPAVRGKVVPEAIFDELKALVIEAHKQQASR